jgi:D-lactate dehydrogenase
MSYISKGWGTRQSINQERIPVMRVAVFSTKTYDRRFLESANESHGHRLTFFDARLELQTCGLAAGHDAVCVFVNDNLRADVAEELTRKGIKLIALRCAGFNNVDLEAAAKYSLTVARVPAYSPNSVAEHTVALILSLNRKMHRAFIRVREGNLSLDGLLGFDLCGRTVGIIGTGKIGLATAAILNGFGCRLLAYDIYKNPDSKRLGVAYVDLDTLYAESNIITIHCPLNPDTHHLIDRPALAKMQDRVMLINTSRGAVIDTLAVIEALKSGKIGYLGLDVYEEEGDIFFKDLSEQVIQDDVFARLLTFPNVLITGHQAFFTEEAMTSIAEVTIGNISAFEKGCIPEVNRVTLEEHFNPIS